MKSTFGLFATRGGKSGGFFLMSDVELSVIARTFREYCDDSFGKWLVFENCFERTVSLVCYARLFVSIDATWPLSVAYSVSRHSNAYTGKGNRVLFCTAVI